MAKTIKLQVHRKKDQLVMGKLNRVAPLVKRNPTDLARILIDEGIDRILDRQKANPSSTQSAAVG